MDSRRTNNGSNCLEFYFYRYYLQRVHRYRHLVQGWLHQRILHRRGKCIPFCKRNGNRSRLDVGCHFYFNGRRNCSRRLWGFQVFNGLDWWVCTSDHPHGPLLAKIRESHRSRLRRRPLLFQCRPLSCRDLCYFYLYDLHYGPNAWSRHCILTPL